MLSFNPSATVALARPTAETILGQNLQKYLEDVGFHVVKTRKNAYGGDDLLLAGGDRHRFILFEVVHRGPEPLTVIGGYVPGDRADSFYMRFEGDLEGGDISFDAWQGLLAKIVADTGETAWMKSLRAAAAATCAADAAEGYW